MPVSASGDSDARSSIAMRSSSSKSISSAAIDHKGIENSLAEIGIENRLGMEALSDLIDDFTNEKADPLAFAQEIENLSLAFEHQRFVHEHEGFFAKKPAKEIGSSLDFFEYTLRYDDAVRFGQISRAIEVDELNREC